MGHKLSNQSVTSCKNPFKLFEYQCSSCKSKRPIQYFYKNDVFLPQQPRVVCGDCHTSVVVEPFKTVDYQCKSCTKWQKVRLPAKPVPLNMYNLSRVACNCGFKGEVPMGRLMDVACSQCWSQKRELRDVWTEDGDEVRTYCEGCQDYCRAFARTPQKKGTEKTADMEYKCDQCRSIKPVAAEDLLRNQGLVCCEVCNWVGYPEVLPKGQMALRGTGSTRTKRPSKQPTSSSSLSLEKKESTRRLPNLPLVGWTSNKRDAIETTTPPPPALNSIVPVAECA
eukprot:TRINITY_DN120846_c0_g1_i1.p1 TRINITY_DN120846_c0_g1~~TRINITY_DN120846_c0_g1_i1.p1  ORF type:complete len:281 (+),score=52.59 TRINITY_DN120846_c0_g1_i1:159-1001(+)